MALGNVPGVIASPDAIGAWQSHHFIFLPTEILRGVYPECRFFSRGVYTERYEILRCAQNDTRSEVLLQNDINEGLRMTDVGRDRHVVLPWKDSSR